MNENIFIDNDKEIKPEQINNITPEENNKNNNTKELNQDEFIKSLPLWDLEPPFEEIRRN